MGEQCKNYYMRTYKNETTLYLELYNGKNVFIIRKFHIQNAR
jgi:hypothetical protein